MRPKHSEHRRPPQTTVSGDLRTIHQANHEAAFTPDDEGTSVMSGDTTAPYPEIGTPAFERLDTEVQRIIVQSDTDDATPTDIFRSDMSTTDTHMTSNHPSLPEDPALSGIIMKKRPKPPLAGILRTPHQKK